jgi:hypothetical protein
MARRRPAPSSSSDARFDASGVTTAGERISGNGIPIEPIVRTA